MPVFSSPEFVLLSGRPGSPQEIAAVDFNGDGKLDIVTSRLHFPLQNAAIRIEILLGTGAGGFVESTATVVDGTAPRNVHPREYVIADFNGDGKPDLFIADHGYDASPFPGYQNQLLLSRPDGSYVNATAKLPQRNDFTHSASAGDVDRDGDLDLYVGNLYGQKQFPPAIFLNNGSGSFKLATGWLPAAQTDIFSAKYSTSLFADFNGDGRVDLFLGADDFTSSSALLLNTAAGKFKAGPRLPAKPFGAKSIALDSQSLDINGDGKLDLVVTYTRGEPFYEDRAVQILVNTGGGKFADQTAERLFGFEKDGPWIRYLHFADLNGDGAKDFMTEPNYPGPAEIFLNDGDGHFFRPAESQVNLNSAFELGDFNGDHKPDVAAWWGSNLVFLAGTGSVAIQTTGTGARDRLFGDGHGNTFSAGGGKDDVRAGAGNDVVDGGTGDDALMGGSGADTIDGGPGNDLLDGGTGADALAGGTGNDRYVVNAKTDVVTEAADGGTDTVRASVSYTLPAEVENLELSGTTGIRGTGNTLANRITGNSGANALDGADGDDVLTGLGGADVLTGGGGKDRFDFDALSDTGTASAKRDRITDFRRGEGDLIDLSDIDANGSGAGNGKFTFIGSKAFSGNATGLLRYDPVTDILYGSTDADTDAEFSILISPLDITNLKGSDFVL